MAVATHWRFGFPIFHSLAIAEEADTEIGFEGDRFFPVTGYAAPQSTAPQGQRVAS